jgi:hypothetical protein
MSKRVKVFLVVAILVVAAAIPGCMLSFPFSAGASTTECGPGCTSPYNESVGSSEVLTVSGSSVELAAASTTDSAQDWTVESEGAVSTAVSAGVLSARLNMLYSGDTVVEYQYAPDGVPSGNCLSDSDEELEDTGTSADGAYYYAPTLTVTLAPCGTTAQSLWILDATNAGDGYVDLINAGYQTFYQYGFSGDADTNFSYTSGLSTYNYDGGFASPFAEPTVLTVNSSGKVVLAQLSELGGVVSTTQMWADYLAADNSALQKAIDAKAR